MPMLQRTVRRLTRFLRLDVTAFQEIASDPGALAEAALVAVVASLLAGLGGYSPVGGSLASFGARLVTGVAVNWLLWAYVTRVAASLIYGGETTFPSLARVLGYALAPLALGMLSIFGCLGDLFGLVGWALTVVYGFFATREITGLGTEHSLVTIAISSIVVLIVDVLVAVLI